MNYFRKGEFFIVKQASITGQCLLLRSVDRNQNTWGLFLSTPALPHCLFLELFLLILLLKDLTIYSLCHVLSSEHLTNMVLFCVFLQISISLQLSPLYNGYPEADKWHNCTRLPRSTGNIGLHALTSSSLFFFPLKVTVTSYEVACRLLGW